jgi:tRNA 2-thiouridine synthesizing protein E
MFQPNYLKSRNKQLRLAYWSVITAYGLAAAEKIRLTADHFEVLNKLREDYVLTGKARHAKQIANLLALAFEQRGGMRYLQQLFPDDFISQSMRIAGLPLPINDEEAFFLATH